MQISVFIFLQVVETLKKEKKGKKINQLPDFATEKQRNELLTFVLQIGNLSVN